MIKIDNSTPHITFVSNTKGVFQTSTKTWSDSTVTWSSASQTWGGADNVSDVLNAHLIIDNKS